MAAEIDPLTSALRTIAREGADDAHRVLPRVEARLVEEVRSMRRARDPRATARAAGLAMAAVVAGAMVVPLWMVANGRRPASRVPAPVAAAAEVTTAFMPLPYGSVPVTDGQILRLEVPRTALAAFGLAPADAFDASAAGTVVADVVVGEDGLARAVRFVRAPRAPGVAP